MKKRIGLGRIIPVLIAILAFFLISSVVYAQVTPQGPDNIVVSDKGRHTNESAPVLIQAKAGNVSALVISHVTSTQSWQGYYGNVTGTIVLDDANNMTFYDWALPDPQGEIYASNFSVVQWNRVYCMNVSHNRSIDGTQTSSIHYSISPADLEKEYGINESDKDGINETFNRTYVDATGFRVGSITIDTVDGCSMVSPYESESPASSWEELILSDNASIIFTALIRENAQNFRSAGTEAADFQMMVLENGHSGHENTMTTYYFFVELS